MSEKLKIPSGGKVIIEINNPPAVQSPKPKTQNAKGLIQVRREDDYLPRRLKTDTYINFYDFGQKANLITEEWEDIPFVVSPAITFSGGFPVSAANFTAANYQALRDLVLSVPVADWKTTYRRVEYDLGKRYDLSVENADGVLFQLKETPGDDMADGIQWVLNKGLRYKNLPKLSVFSRSAFWQFDLSNAADYRITATSDPTSAEIPFEISGSFDVFLMPRIAFEVGVSEQNDGAGSAHTSYLHWNYRPHRRDFFIYNADYEAANGGNSAFEDNSFSRSNDSDGFFAELAAFLRAQDGGRLYSTVAAGGAITFQGYESVSNFPRHSAGKFKFYYRGSYGFGLNNLIGLTFGFNAPTYAGLIAVILKNDVPFYVWEYSSSFAFEQSSSDAWTITYS